MSWPIPKTAARAGWYVLPVNCVWPESARAMSGWAEPVVLPRWEGQVGLRRAGLLLQRVASQRAVSQRAVSQRAGLLPQRVASQRVASQRAALSRRNPSERKGLVPVGAQLFGVVAGGRPSHVQLPCSPGTPVWHIPAVVPAHAACWPAVT
jgi:hypothetical protein